MNIHTPNSRRDYTVSPIEKKKDRHPEGGGPMPSSISSSQISSSKYLPTSVSRFPAAHSARAGGAYRG
jgi:hypothetical protein